MKTARKVLSDTGEETLLIACDGERFALIRRRTQGGEKMVDMHIVTIILNPKEMEDMDSFYKEVIC